MTPDRAVEIVERMTRVAPLITPGALLITRGGRAAEISRAIKFRRADGNSDRSYEGWVGWIYDADGTRSHASWTLDGAASAYYSLDDDDLIGGL